MRYAMKRLLVRPNRPQQARPAIELIGDSFEDCGCGRFQRGGACEGPSYRVLDEKALFVALDVMIPFPKSGQLPLKALNFRYLVTHRSP
jgi:hypothetical protein